MKKYLLLLFCLTLLFDVAAQNYNRTSYFRDLVLKVDTARYRLTEDFAYVKGEKHLLLGYQKDQEVAEINLIPYDFDQIKSIKFHPSADYEVLDSLLNIDYSYYRVKIRFNNITKSNFISFVFTVVDAITNQPLTQEIKIQPVTETYVKFYPEDDGLYIGEEKIFELVTNNLANLRLNLKWTSGQAIDYRFSEKNGQLRLHLLPNALGSKVLETRLETIKPMLQPGVGLVFDHPTIQQEFTVKSSRIQFLNIDKKEVTYQPGNVEPIEVQLDNSWLLELKKTYRIENQEQPGGALVAELFTRNSLSNNRVLCYLRVYAYHRTTQGYLYIKDGDAAKFITNFSITPVASIEKVSILREGGDWSSNLNVLPGETVDVRIEGNGLQKANFHFDGAEKITSDSLIFNEQLAIHKVKIPLNINKGKINIYNNGEVTTHSLSVKEYNLPYPLQFVNVNYGVGNMPLGGLNKTILYDKTIRDVIISFQPELLDANNKLHGKQYLEMEVRLSGAKNELLEIKTIEDIVICPGDNSPRFAYYNDKQCNKAEISLNSILGKKTYNLEDWSRILITIKHRKDKYGGEGYTERIELILQKHTNFDIDVSFPAGLITKKLGGENEGFSSLGGISMAMIAQFSFFKPNKIAQYRPYRIGAGFIALDAFNFSQSASNNRDVGVVILGTLYPARRDVKLSFPLNLGGGFLMQESTWFFLIGPGIRLRL